MKVTVFGSGYVGLVQSAILADAGHQVFCVDIDASRISKLNEGHIPIYEPGLDAIIKDTVSDGRLIFTTDVKLAISHGDIQFIAVGTPQSEDGSADLQHVLTVAKNIGMHINEYKLVINKSTVPVGTADKVNQIILNCLNGRNISIDFDVVSNPEFLKEGAAVSDCKKPDRIIIGTDSLRAEQILRELFEPFNRNHDRIIIMSPRSAELTKYAANCMLASKISLMNEFSNIAELLGADIESVRNGIGSDQRIGYHFIYPGPGYGGSCFPKDVSALIHSAESHSFDPLILKAVEARNSNQKRIIFDKILNHFGGQISGKRIAIWGLSFKPNTDDMREAPSRVLMESLWNMGVTIQAFDPAAMEEAQRLYSNRHDLILCGTKESALKGADALVIMTEWSQFKAPNFDIIKSELNEPLIFDGRNLFEPARMRERGFKYFSIGRG